MPAYTLAEAQEFYDAAKTAYLASLNAQEYYMGNRRLRRPESNHLYEQMMKWKNLVAKLKSGGGIRITGATPI